MLLTLSHLQKDDSLVPLLPYATGSLLASLLLTISGIAETHPQALALATYLIQLGWLLLQIQGVMLVYTFGSHGQGRTLFKVWLVSMQLLDMHRQFPSNYLGAVAGLLTGSGYEREGYRLDGTTVVESGLGSVSGTRHSCRTFRGMDPMKESMDDRTFQQGIQISTVPLFDIVVSVLGYYTGILCNVALSVCESVASSFTSTLWAVSSFFTTLEGYTINIAPYSQSKRINDHDQQVQYSEATTQGAGAGMKEMENLVVFEVLAGLGVSGLMCLVWAAMVIHREGVVAIPGVRRTKARVQRWHKAIRGLRDEWREAVEGKVDKLVDQMKFRVDS